MILKSKGPNTAWRNSKHKIRKCYKHQLWFPASYWKDISVLKVISGSQNHVECLEIKISCKRLLNAFDRLLHLSLVYSNIFTIFCHKKKTVLCTISLEKTTLILEKNWLGYFYILSGSIKKYAYWLIIFNISPDIFFKWGHIKFFNSGKTWTK